MSCGWFPVSWKHFSVLFSKCACTHLRSYCSIAATSCLIATFRSAKVWLHPLDQLKCKVYCKLMIWGTLTKKVRSGLVQRSCGSQDITKMGSKAAWKQTMKHICVWSVPISKQCTEWYHLVENKLVCILVELVFSVVDVKKCLPCESNVRCWL